MYDASWDRITDAIDARYGLTKHGKLERTIPERADLTEKVQFIEFEREDKLYRLERVLGPAIIDRKTVGARRAGAAVHYEYVYDEHETSARMDLLRQDDGEWLRIDPSELGLT